MELDLKGLGKKDMLLLKEIPQERERVIRNSSSNAINTKFVANEIAESLHPTIQYVKVADIIEEGRDAKTFVFVPDIDAGTKKLATFRPGQYISVKVEIEEGIYRRPYTISCSPKNAYDNIYTITIKRRPRGIVSNYFLDEVKIDDKFMISAPTGNFYYEPIRDAKHIIALAGGSGITPFISMAEAILDGILDCKLTILYGARTESDLLFHKKLEEMAEKSKYIQVEYILSEEENPNYQTGFITKELIEKYMENETSFFVCGPLSLYDAMNEVLKEFNVPNKYIRTDAFFGRMDLRGNDYYNLTILARGQEVNIPCCARETLLYAMEKNGINAPSKCHVGECGFCRSKLKSGKVKTFDGTIRTADKEYEFIHPCASFPESDVVIELPF